MTSNKIINELLFLKEKLFNGIFSNRIECIDAAIKIIQEAQQYREFGTVDEIEAAVNKTNAMEVTDIHVDEYYCPNCGSENMCDQGVIEDHYCPNCGQRLKVKNNE